MTDDFPAPAADDIELVDVLRALADPIRLEIVRKLGDGQRHCKTTEDWDLGVQKSTLSHHLRTLREAGVTLTIVDGRVHWLQLRRADLDARFPGLLDGVLTGTGASDERVLPDDHAPGGRRRRG